MKQLEKWRVLIFFVMLIPIVISCGDDEEEDNGDIETTSSRNYSTYEKEMVNKLTGTSWNLYKRKISNNYYDASGIIIFGDNESLNCLDFLLFNGERVSADGSWFFKDNKLMTIIKNAPTQVALGAIISILGVENTIKTLDSNTMVLVGDDGEERYYSNTKNNPNNPNDPNGGGSSSGDIPYVIGYNFTATKTTIEVKFTCTERPSSASIMYGETQSLSKSVSPTISAKQVSATVKGLKSGTKYYFKCTVRNEYGSSTSDVVVAMTDY